MKGVGLKYCEINHKNHVLTLNLGKFGLKVKNLGNSL
jgi:hypothetical protein